MGFTSARRWMANLKRKKNRAQMTEGNIQPDEARTAAIAIIAQVGGVLQEVLSYDAREDELLFLAWFPHRGPEGELDECSIPGESLCQLVMHTRMMAGQPAGLMRPSELYAALKATAESAA